MCRRTGRVLDDLEGVLRLDVRVLVGTRGANELHGACLHDQCPELLHRKVIDKRAELKLQRRHVKIAVTELVSLLIER